MQSLAEKFLQLKTRIGGNREKTQFEHTFGIPQEELAHITMPNAWQRRLLGQLEFALRLSADCNGSWDDLIGSTLDQLNASLDQEGVIGRSQIQQVEKQLLPMQSAAREYQLILAAHAHIDMNWMWSWQETVTATLETFRTMLNMMEAYPDFCFSQSQASCYKIVEDYEPEMMPLIRQRIQEGRWEVTASSWVETDKNMPNTESLVRHILYTKQYLEETWGVDPESLSLDFSPDTFGHSAHLPELVSHGGVRYYYHCRGLADDHILYRWQSPSGRELLVCREPYWYNSGITPHIGAGLVDIASRCAGLKTGLIVYGVGDHGGGPTRRDVERAREMMQWPIYPKIRFGKFADYFQVAEQFRDQLPLVNQEMNFIFTGCYTTQSRIKLGNRKSETALADAEFSSALAQSLSGATYSGRAFAAAWQKVLFTHFHDILTGSCVQDSREHAMGLYSDALAVANTQRARAMRAIADQIDTTALFGQHEPADPDSQAEGAGAGFGIDGRFAPPATERGSGLTRIWHVFNPMAQAQQRTVEITVWDWPGDLRRIDIVDGQGIPLQWQLLDQSLQHFWDHKYFRILVAVSLPAGGYATCLLRQRPLELYPHYFQEDIRTHQPETNYILENSWLRAIFCHQTAGLISLVDKQTGCELVKPGQSAGLQLVDTETKGHGAWVIGRYMSVTPLRERVKIEPFQPGGSLRQGLAIELPFRKSTAKALIWLDQNSPALHYDLTVDWHEYSTATTPTPLLTFQVPLAFQPETFRYDVPAGCQDRQAMHLDVPGLQYAAAVSGERALMLTSDCKYGYRGTEDSLAVSLIHAANHPDPYPERGIHSIGLALIAGSSEPRQLHQLAYACYHLPAYLSSRPQTGTLPLQSGLLELSSETTAVISAVKGAESGSDMIIRLYNTTSRPTRAVIRAPLPICSATCVDLLENPLAESCRQATFSDRELTVSLDGHALASIRLAFDQD